MQLWKKWITLIISISTNKTPIGRLIICSKIKKCQALLKLSKMISIN